MHLVVIGGGSAAFAATLKASALGARVTMFNAGLPIGGTCVNVGCIPSKALIRAAGAHFHAGNSRFGGVSSESTITDFQALISQERALVEELRQAKYVDIVAELPRFRLVEEPATLIDERTVEAHGERFSADRILLATGAAPTLPPVPGLKDTWYLTNADVFELDELPETVVVLGGRYVALEIAQMLARLGSSVTVLQRSSRILPTEASDLTDMLTGFLRDEGIRIVTDVELQRVRQEGAMDVVDALVNGEPRSFAAGRIVVATGRHANTDGLGLEAAGVAVDGRGFIRVGPDLQTSAPGIYAAGDVIGEPMFVYTAAYEGALAAENALVRRGRNRDYTALPWVVFTDPQVAGVGLDEWQAAEHGISAETAVLPLEHVPRALVGRDTRGFVKLIRDVETDRLIGARILAPEGSELTMEISVAIKCGLTTQELADMFHPYLTLGEAVKLAAITFRKDVGALSCCAA